MSSLVVEDLVSGLSEWRNIQEIVRMTFNALHDVVKAQGEAIKSLEGQVRELQTSAMEKASRSELNSALRNKANIPDVNRSIMELERLLDTKAETSAVRELVDKKFKAATKELERAGGDRASKAEFDNFAALVKEDIRQAHRSLVDMDRKLEGKADQDYLAAHFASKAEVAALQTLVAQADEARAFEKSLDTKASKSELNGAISSFMQEMSEVTRTVSEMMRELSEKADTTFVAAQLEKRVSKAELQATLRANLEEVQGAVDRQDHAVKGLRLDLESKLAGLQDALASKAGKQAVENALHSKASRSQLEEAVTRLETGLARKADKDEVQSATLEARRELELFATRAEVEAKFAAGDQKLDARAAAAARQLRTEVEGRIDSIQEVLDAKASAAEVRAATSSKADKNEVAALRQAVEQLDRIVERKANLDELHAALEGKADTKDLIQKINTQDVFELVDTKAGIEDVNRVLAEVNKELNKRAKADEIQEVQVRLGDVSQALAHMAMYGRWIWKSGKTKGPGGGVPWNVQVVNTAPDNFQWEKDRVNIQLAAPGLYEVTFGFYARKKPTVQLLVNGDPVLSAMNSTSYAVHHSSGRLTSVDRHPAGNVTGLTLLDFLALPPRAKIAITYAGEEGAEGFIGLRKL
eukprot:tig00000989_g6104.t1